MHKLALFGWPLSHSLSPQLHQALLQLSNIKAEYALRPVRDFDALRRELDACRQISIERPQVVVAANITLPFKRLVLTEVDHPDAVVLASGCANTLHFLRGEIHAYNTDVIGFEQANFARRESLPWLKALVLGGGGCAQAVVHALSSYDVEIRVCSRREPEWIAASKAVWLPFSQGSNAFAEWTPHLWVQATSASVLGSEPELLQQLEGWTFDTHRAFPGHATPLAAGAFETNYQPTLWQDWARRRGLALRPYAGLSMLILQAIAMHERIFGLEAGQIERLKNAVPKLMQQLTAGGDGTPPLVARSQRHTKPSG